MTTYAVIILGVVRNVVIAISPAVAQSTISGSTVVDVGALSVTIGDLYNGTVFTPGPSPSAQFRSEVLSDFFSTRITSSELSLISTALLSNAPLRMSWDMYSGGRMSMSAFLDVLVSNGIFTPLRRDQFRI